jgi:hypothetical protein
VVILALVLLGIPASRAVASSGQVSIIQDDPHLDRDPAGTLARMRLLGAQVVRVSVPWNYIAPAIGSAHPPRGFNGANPAAYPASRWQLWDAIATAAHNDGMIVDFDLMGGAPRWAQGPGRPPQLKNNQSWEPSASYYGAFVHAISERYSGTYVPAGATAPLPRVDFWTIWNEPDYGPSLAPQGVFSPGCTFPFASSERRCASLKVENSPWMYRNLLDAAWGSLLATGHGPSTDTIAWGELAPRGESFWGVASGMKPLTFLRALYCVDSNYHPLRGTAASLRGCPTTAAASRQFRSQHPALFGASGVTDHPYMRWYPPNHEFNPDPVNHSSTAEYSSLGVIGNLTRALDRLQGVYGSRTRFPIYDTEFAYMTSPPKHSPEPKGGYTDFFLSPTTASAYMNWAEYLSWRNPRIRSFQQYLLYDPLRPTKHNDYGGFASGLLTWNGVQKATYDAWRLPLYLPVTTTRRGQALEVWGCVRPALYGALDSESAQTADIQFAPRGSGQYVTVDTVPVSSGSCYFDRHITFGSSGTVRLVYTYPTLEPSPAGGVQVPSRTVAITVR